LLSALSHDLPPDNLDHRVCLQQHLPIVETQHLQAETAQIGIADRVTGAPVRREMLRTIHFDHQLGRRRVEIHDESTDGFLPIELHAPDLLPAYTEPQSLLGIGHAGTQPAGEFLQVSVVFQHAGSKAFLPVRPESANGVPHRRENAFSGDLTPGFPPLKKGGRGDLLFARHCP